MSSDGNGATRRGVGVWKEVVRVAVREDLRRLDRRQSGGEQVSRQEQSVRLHEPQKDVTRDPPPRCALFDSLTPHPSPLESPPLAGLGRR